MFVAIVYLLDSLTFKSCKCLYPLKDFSQYEHYNIIYNLIYNVTYRIQDTCVTFLRSISVARDFTRLKPNDETIL